MWRKLVVLVIVLGAPFVLLAASFTLAAASTPSNDTPIRIAPPLQAGLPAERGPQAAEFSEAPGLGVRLVSSDERGAVLELLTPEFQIEQGTADGRPCQLVTVAGYGAIDTPGWPRLPVKGAMVGIPARAQLTLTVLESDLAALNDRYDVCPVSHPIAETDLAGEIKYAGEESSRDAQAYASDSYYPASLAEVVSAGLIRSQPVAQLQFHPLRYNPVSGELQYYKRIRVRLDFGAAGIQASAAGGQQEEPFDPVLRATLANYEDARRWRVGRAPVASQAEAAGQGQAAYKLAVNEDGIYQVTDAQLLAAGAPVSSLNPCTLRLTNRGQEVAITVAGEADGSFDPGDYLLFYGQKMDTKYTDVNVYWLTWGGADCVARMSAPDGTPGGATVPSYFLTTRHLEQNILYSSANLSGPDHDHWYWSPVYAASSPTSTSYTTILEHVATGPLSATIRGLFKGYSANPWHHTRVYLNGHMIDSATWLPQAEYAFEVSVPQSYLVEGTNAISVECPLDGGVTTDVVFVNWFEIAYYHTYTADGAPFFFGADTAGTWKYQVGGFYTDTLELFDVTTPTSPTVILSATAEPGGGVYTLTFQQTITAGHRYVALSPAQRESPLRIEEDRPSDLHSTANAADYIIITHGDFYTDALRLADYRADRLPPYHPPRKMRTAVVDVQDVYDEFNYGVFDPEAIHRFLVYAYANWAAPAPAYVLLMGDGNYDFRNYYGRGEPNYIPPYMADVDPEVGEVPADNRYVCVSGDDIWPDMHIGRLPVKTSAEAGAVVTKVLSYEQNPSGGNWSQRALFVADDPDDAGNFYALSDDVLNHYLPAPYVPDKIYYGSPPYTTGSTAQKAIISAINTGRLVVNYVGHGSNQAWAAERLFRLADVAALTNAGRLPLVVPMTCLEGYFVVPSSPTSNLSCLAETFVRAPNQGAIASWSPTGMGLAAGHDFLNRGLFEALFFDGVDQIGPATTQAKLYLYGSTGDYQDLLDTYVLFGDPALQLAVLKADLSITKTVAPAGVVQPGGTVTYTLTYANAGPATAHHVVITDTLPAALRDPNVTSAGAAITPRAGSRFAWDVADLAAGEGGTITITAVVSPTLAGAPIVNTATITATAVEINTANNSSTSRISAKPYSLYLPIIRRSRWWDWWQ